MSILVVVSKLQINCAAGVLVWEPRVGSFESAIKLQERSSDGRAGTHPP